VEVGRDDATVTSSHRPISGILNALAESGSRLDEAAEPRPQAGFLERAPDHRSPEERPRDLPCPRATRMTLWGYVDSNAGTFSQ